MNKKELIWKYFKEQKKEELLTLFKSIKIVLYNIGAVLIFILALFLIVFSGVSILMFLIGIFFFEEVLKSGSIFLYYTGMVLLPLSIIAGVIYWLVSNWNKAKKRAEKELKCKH